MELDLHRLELRFAEQPAGGTARGGAVGRVDRAVRPDRAVHRGGGPRAGWQGGGAEALVLIDGYRRVAALRRLGRDTAGVEQWSCDLTKALLGVLARTQDRPFASIEEALLLRALMAEHGTVAARSGAAVRSRRELGQPAAAIAVGIARCGAGGGARRPAVELGGEPGGGPVGARQRRACRAAVERAGRRRRCRRASCGAGSSITSRPRAPPASTWSADRACSSTRCGRTRRARAGERLRDGPEGECIGDLRCLEAVIARLRKRVATLRPLPPPLIAAAPRLRHGDRSPDQRA